jgi:hypothetical protein
MVKKKGFMAYGHASRHPEILKDGASFEMGPFVYGESPILMVGESAILIYFCGHEFHSYFKLV